MANGTNRPVLRKLAERFGAEYDDYRKRTSFLVPLPQKKRSQ